MNHRATLGLPNTANADEIKKTYRKLAMVHHPDRGGDQEKFKAIQYAYMELERSGFAPFSPPRQPPQQSRPNTDWNKPEAPGGTWRDRNESIDDILDQMRQTSRKSNSYQHVQPGAEVVANISLREAFSGFNMQVSRQKSNGMIEHVYVNIPPGTPHGHRGKYRLSDGSTQVIITKIDGGNYHVRGFSDADNLFAAGLRIGDIETEIEIDALDLITGCWIKVKDFVGEELTVRVPAGFNPLQRLKVADKGYAGWSEERQAPATYRMDMYIKLRAMFRKPQDIDRKKIIALYNSIEGWKDESEQDTV